MLPLWRERSYRKKLQEQSQEVKVIYLCKDLTSFLCLLELVGQLLITVFYVYHIQFLMIYFIADVKELTHYHQTDPFLLVVPEAVAEVIVEAVATGVRWIVHLSFLFRVFF